MNPSNKHVNVTTKSDTTINIHPTNQSSTPPNCKNNKPSERPVGTKRENMDLIDKSVNSVQTEITCLYKKEMLKAKALGYNHVRVGTYNKIHNDIKKQCNLPYSKIY
jgi:hypothetical protein